ncbi:type II secretion system protein [Candidatus Giovannonibacteria bacterium]|nr:type II secretion system protein [Candidatus Giovannonibacteria bacterium]
MKKGYTLLETLIYVTILAVVAIIVVGSILTLYQAFIRNRIERKLSYSGDAAIETLVREIRAASSTNPATSAFASHPGILDLSKGTVFSLSGTDLRVSYEGAAAENLTSSGVRTTNLIFYRNATTSSEIIKIEITLEAGEGRYTKSKNFFGSAVLRENY